MTVRVPRRMPRSAPHRQHDERLAPKRSEVTVWLCANVTVLHCVGLNRTLHRALILRLLFMIRPRVFGFSQLWLRRYFQGGKLRILLSHGSHE